MCTRVVRRQEAIVGVATLRKLGITGIDLNHLAGLTIPPQPPPLLTVVPCGDQRNMTAIMTSDQLTTEAILVRPDILGKRGQPHQLVGVDDAVSSQAAHLSRPRRGATCHFEITSLTCPDDGRSTYHMESKPGHSRTLITSTRCSRQSWALRVVYAAWAARSGRLV
jgi:hypothetical protein